MDFIAEKPTILFELESITREVGSDQILHCHADGLPKPSITWTFNNKPLNGKIDFHFNILILYIILFAYVLYK